MSQEIRVQQGFWYEGMISWGSFSPWRPLTDLDRAYMLPSLRFVESRDGVVAMSDAFDGTSKADRTWVEIRALRE